MTKSSNPCGRVVGVGSGTSQVWRRFAGIFGRKAVFVTHAGTAAGDVGWFEMSMIQPVLVCVCKSKVTKVLVAWEEVRKRTGPSREMGSQIFAKFYLCLFVTAVRRMSDWLRNQPDEYFLAGHESLGSRIKDWSLQLLPFRRAMISSWHLSAVPMSCRIQVLWRWHLMSCSAQLQTPLCCEGKSVDSQEHPAACIVC